MVEFEENERVMILSKSMGDPLGRGYAYNMYKGEFGYVELVRISDGISNSLITYPPKGTKYYTVKGGLFLGNDLRRAPR